MQTCGSFLFVCVGTVKLCDCVIGKPTGCVSIRQRQNLPIFVHLKPLIIAIAEGKSRDLILSFHRGDTVGRVNKGNMAALILTVVTKRKIFHFVAIFYAISQLHRFIVA